MNTVKIIHTGLRMPTIEDKRAHVIHSPTIKVKYRKIEILDAVKRIMGKECYVVFLSQTGVRGLHEYLSRQRESLYWDHSQLWAVGDRTAETIRELLKQNVRVPERQDAKGLIGCFRTLPKKPVVLFTGEMTRPEFPDWLQQRGWASLIVPVYQTEIHKNPNISGYLQDGEIKGIIFTSPTTVQGFLTSTNYANLSEVKIPLFSIGATTSAEIRSHQGWVAHEAKTPDVNLLINQIMSRT